jgi:hypothetical protein
MVGDAEDTARLRRAGGVDEACPLEAPKVTVAACWAASPGCQFTSSQLGCHAADVLRLSGEKVQHHRS